MQADVCTYHGSASISWSCQVCVACVVDGASEKNGCAVCGHDEGVGVKMAELTGVEFAYLHNKRSQALCGGGVMQ